MNSLSVLVKILLVSVLSGKVSYLYAESATDQTRKSDNSILIATGLSETHAFFKLAEEVLGVIASRMDEKITLISIPGKRAASLLKNHDIHAELARIAEYKQKVPSAIKVSEPVIELSRYAYSTSYDFPVNSWDSLKPYHTVAIRGS